MSFLGDDYLLETETARTLYEGIADLPIVDSHSHADVVEIVENEGWSDVWEVEGATDHYAWALMRNRGVPEEKITGDATNREKWEALAEVFPAFAGNPTYEWVHLDLKPGSGSTGRPRARPPTRSGRRRPPGSRTTRCASSRSSARWTSRSSAAPTPDLVA